MQKTHPILAGLAVSLLSALMFGQSGIGPITTSVSSARPRQGHPSTRLAPGYKFQILAEGEMDFGKSLGRNHELRIPERFSAATDRGYQNRA